MPRARLGSSDDGAPLTVAAVSTRLGVSASTLRTWERRYGLGPSERRAGAHRRYSPGDIARLERMIELLATGVSAADAAAAVLAHSYVADSRLDAPIARTPQDLLDAAESGSIALLKEMMVHAIGEDGLVHTWSRLIAPAITATRADHSGNTPGMSPVNLLAAAILDILVSIAQRCVDYDGDVGSVLILTDYQHELAANVVGVALKWHGIKGSLVTTETIGGCDGIERFRSHVADNDADLAIVMGSGVGCEKFLGVVIGEYELDTILVGPDTPRIVDSHVLRVRTPAACVEETLAILAPNAVLGTEGAD